MCRFLFLPVVAVMLLLVSCGTSRPDVSGDAQESGGGEAVAGVGEGSPQPDLPVSSVLPVSSFREIWGYVVAGREASLKTASSLTDVGYFGAELDSYGKLTGIPSRAKLAFYRGRVHLVAASEGRSLTHFALESGGRTRRELVQDLIAAASGFDGLQIDFEYVPARDGDAFLSFLGELRAALPPEKMFSVALPARTRVLENDVYDYRKIRPLVDRILVMAYDEHWSTSAPGPIASLDWCRNIARYSLEVVGGEKLIMGLPFYGRTWGSHSPNRAFFFSGIERLIREYGVTDIERTGGIPHFTYEVPLTVTAWYEDGISLSGKMEMYRSLGIRSVGFWSVGQETPEIWSIISLDRD